MREPVRFVLAVDPGLRTGWALWKDGEITGGITDPLETGDFLKYEIQAAPLGRSEVVCESYTVTAQTAKLSQQYWSLELIGVARWLCHYFGAEFVEPLQKPSEAKRFVPDQRLRDLGLWVPGREDHERDARRHLVLRLAKHGLIDVRPL